MSAQPPTDSMYVAQEKIYPREIKGRYQTLRKLMVFLLLGLFLCVAMAAYRW